MSKTLSITTTIALALIVALPASASANSGTITLSSVGSGGYVGQNQVLTAAVTNTSQQAFPARVCVAYDSYKNFLILQRDVSGSSQTTCVDLSNFNPGQPQVISWTFKGKAKTPSIAPQFLVTLYQITAAGTQALTSSRKSYVVRRKPVIFKINPVQPTNSTRLVNMTLGNSRVATYRLSNIGGTQARNWWMCIQRRSALTPISVAPFPSSTNRNCAKGNKLSAGRNVSIIYNMRAVRPGSGQISLYAGYNGLGKNRIASYTAPFRVAPYKVAMETTNAIIFRGKTRIRQVDVTNTGESSPDLKACVKVKGGKLLALEGRSRNCFFIGSIARGKNYRLDIKASSAKAKATVTVSVPRSQAQKYTYTFPFKR